jgi:hypothetical protein
MNKIKYCRYANQRPLFIHVIAFIVVGTLDSTPQLH